MTGRWERTPETGSSIMWLPAGKVALVTKHPDGMWHAVVVGNSWRDERNSPGSVSRHAAQRWAEQVAGSIRRPKRLLRIVQGGK